MINTTGGVNGTFANLAINGHFGIVQPHIEYDGNNVYLVLGPNALPLTGLTRTRARSPARSTPPSRTATRSRRSLRCSIFCRVRLPGALDQLSGEVHASTAGVLLDESLIRARRAGRLRQASYGGDASMARFRSADRRRRIRMKRWRALAYGKSPIVTKAPLMAARPGYDVVFWAQGFGARGKFEADGNATSVRRDLAGFFSGVDTRVGANGRVGIAAGYTGSSIALEGRGSSNVETGHLTGYGGWSSARSTCARGGAGVARDRYHRNVAFPGFFDSSTANYNGRTGQIFGEAGYGFAFGNVAVEPFAGAALVSLRTDGANERGGLAALAIAANSFDVGYSTLGIRAASMIPLARDMMLVPRASVAWQHAFNDVTPDARLAFVAAPAPFVIAGAPLARDLPAHRGRARSRHRPQRDARRLLHRPARPQRPGPCRQGQVLLEVLGGAFVESSEATSRAAPVAIAAACRSCGRAMKGAIAPSTS